jgi:DNA-binding NarL/FixJ family response regulator
LLQQINPDTTPEPIRVMIYDSTLMGCQLLSHMLESCSYNLTIVGCSVDFTGTDDPRLNNADIALISGDQPDTPGAELQLAQAIRQSKPAVRCIMLLNECDRDQVVEAFRSGVVGLCGRHESCEVLCKCIDRVYHGQVWANSEQLRYALETLSAGSHLRMIDTRRGAFLTRREEDIVYLVAGGLRNREVAEQLKLSEHTVRNYLFRIFEKLGISSRAELILYSAGRPVRQSAAG